MPTQRYRCAAGHAVPGVTTVLGLLNKPALIPWAWKLGKEGKDYRRTTDKAADIGTITHYMIECFLNNRNLEGLDEFSTTAVRQAKVAYQNFEQWWLSQGLVCIGTEASLISETMQCGGTIDVMAEHGPYQALELWLVDIKTSKAVYAEHLYQLSAYWALWNENWPNRPIHSAHIVQLSKEDGRLSHHVYPSLYRELEVFRHLRAVYALMKDRDPKRALDRLYKKYNLDRL